MDNNAFFNLNDHPAKGDTFHFSTRHFFGGAPVKHGKMLDVYQVGNVLVSSTAVQAESWWHVPPEKRGVSVA